MLSLSLSSGRVRRLQCRPTVLSIRASSISLRAMVSRLCLHSALTWPACRRSVTPAGLRSPNAGLNVEEQVRWPATAGHNLPGLPCRAHFVRPEAGWQGTPQTLAALGRLAGASGDTPKAARRRGPRMPHPRRVALTRPFPETGLRVGDVRVCRTRGGYAAAREFRRASTSSSSVGRATPWPSDRFWRRTSATNRPGSPERACPDASLTGGIMSRPSQSSAGRPL